MKKGIKFHLMDTTIMEKEGFKTRLDALTEKLYYYQYIRLIDVQYLCFFYDTEDDILEIEINDFLRGDCIEYKDFENLDSELKSLVEDYLNHFYKIGILEEV